MTESRDRVDSAGRLRLRYVVVLGKAAARCRPSSGGPVSPFFPATRARGPPRLYSGTCRTAPFAALVAIDA